MGCSRQDFGLEHAIALGHFLHSGIFRASIILRNGRSLSRNFLFNSSNMLESGNVAQWNKVLFQYFKKEYPTLIFRSSLPDFVSVFEKVYPTS